MHLLQARNLDRTYHYVGICVRLFMSLRDLLGDPKEVKNDLEVVSCHQFIESSLST